MKVEVNIRKVIETILKNYYLRNQTILHCKLLSEKSLQTILTHYYQRTQWDNSPQTMLTESLSED